MESFIEREFCCKKKEFHLEKGVLLRQKGPIFEREFCFEKKEFHLEKGSSISGISQPIKNWRRNQPANKNFGGGISKPTKKLAAEPASQQNLLAAGGGNFQPLHPQVGGWRKTN